jgi:PfaD family protein
MGFPSEQAEGVQEKTKGSLGWWVPEEGAPRFLAGQVTEASARFREASHIIQHPENGALGIGLGGSVIAGQQPGAFRLVGSLPPLYPEWLGNPEFCRVHGLRFPYLAGAMATGIGSEEVVIEMARAGMMGFFGSAGLSPERCAQAIDKIQAALNPAGLSYGINFIHFPMDPSWEEKMVDLFLAKGVTRIEASAFLRITPALVRYVVKGLVPSTDGKFLRKHFVLAKLSRPEVAEQFMSPAPEAVLKQLLEQGKITEQEAGWARRVPLADDITVEADSGGHTDNRPLTALFSTLQGLALKLQEKFQYPTPFRIGAGGGIGTPMAVAAAFSLGASYVLTGSVNQPCIESGTSPIAKAMLCEAAISDMMMAPAADMFEMGVKVQVLKKGTMWPVRGQKLYELYKGYEAWEQIPEAERQQVEKDFFRDRFENIWAGTREFFEKRDPSQVEKAEKNPKHKMALVFRWYLGMGSRWAMQGVADRKMDYQIWCGPALGAFNEWVKGTFLAEPAERRVAQIALNLMEGAAMITRAQQWRSYGVSVPETAFCPRPQKII